MPKGRKRNRSVDLASNEDDGNAASKRASKLLIESDKKRDRARRREDREKTRNGNAVASKMTGNTKQSNVFRESEMLKWFDELRTDESTGKVEQSIGPSGVERLAKEIGKDLNDVVFLVLAYKMGAKEMGYFTKEEWVKGMSALRVDSPEKLVAIWDLMRTALDKPDSFRNVYRFAYDFTKEKEVRHLEKSVAIELINLLLGDRWKICNEFCKFLEAHHMRVINKDQFNNVLEFHFLVNDDCSDYDMESAWPVLMDEFVSHMRDKVFKKENSSNGHVDEIC